MKLRFNYQANLLMTQLNFFNLLKLILRFFVFFCLLISLNVFSAQRNLSLDNKFLKTSGASKKVALIIGNSNYKDAARLKNPVNDATAMSNALNKLGFEVAELTDATQKEMNRAISQFGRRLNGDTVGFFFYAGHGLQVKGKNYLVPIDALIDSEASVPTETVEIDSVLAQLASSSLSIVVLDACRNNPFESKVRATGGGLAQIDAPKGSFIAFATSPGRTAADGSGSNGVYTSELIKQISIPNLPIESVFKKVRANVAKLTGDAQIPWESTSLVGDFYFNQDSKDTELNRQEDFQKIEQQKKQQQEAIKRLEDEKILKKAEEIKQQQEEAKKIAEQKKQEELRRAAELAKQQEEAKKIAEQKKQEELRRAAELAKQQEEAKKIAEQKKQEELRRAAELAKQQEEAKKIAEQKKQEELRRAAELANTSIKANAKSDSVKLSTISPSITTSDGSKKWAYSYTKNLGDNNPEHNRQGTIIFSIKQDKESGVYDLNNDKFEQIREVPKADEVVSFHHPHTRETFYDLLPYLNANNNFDEISNIKNININVPISASLHDYSWQLKIQKIGVEKITINGKFFEAYKIAINGERPTMPGNCTGNMDGIIKANIWYAKDIKRYIKQEINIFSCRFGGTERLRSAEVYELIKFSE
jgi:uncharacterized caspase-like protein